MSKILIIGAGASGLIASIYAKDENNEVILLERNPEPAKKILVTGNGRCNYYNEDQDLKHYNSENQELISEIITEENKKEILKFFNKIGIIPKIKNGYYYPYSNQATSIKNALINEAKRKNVNIITNTYVESIIPLGEQYKVLTNNTEYIVDKVVIATGSFSAPKTGSDGNGYTLVEKLGHSLITPLPALTALKGNARYFKEWSGIRSDVKIKLYNDKEFIKEEQGEIQLTDYGISGICTFNLSRHANKILSKNGKPYVYINFLPLLENNELNFLEERNKLMNDRTIDELLDGILNYKLTNVILKLLNIKKDTKYNELTQNQKESLIEKITKFEIEIVDSNPFDASQVCMGGVPLTEINRQTMESKLNTNIYIIGELLDVDGECGGYNLTFAWISGMLAGKSCKQ